MIKNYILISIDNPDSTFIMEEQDYEIYSVKILENNASDIIVRALTQSDAFKEFKKIYPQLFKRSNKKFYEKELFL